MDFSFINLVTPENISMMLSASTATLTATYFVMRRVHNIRVKALESNLADEHEAKENLQKEHENRFQETMKRHEDDLRRLRQRYETEMARLTARIDTLESRWQESIVSQLKDKG